MNKVYSNKQRALLRLWQKNELKRINILEGSVSSGKTWISLVLWAFWVATMPTDGSYLMVAKTLTSLRRNCLDLLQDLVGPNNFTYSLSQKDGCLFGRKIYLEGVNDARAESKIRGMTLQGAYCDEITLFTKDFFAMLLSRLRKEGAKLIGTTNPDTPGHWLKKEYTGVFHDRFILGKWVLAEGLIYRQYANNKKRYSINRKSIPDLKYINVGIDFGGNSSQHAFVASGFPSAIDRVFVLRSESIKAAGTSVEDIVTMFIHFAEHIEKEYGFIDTVYADSAEQAIINELRNKTKYDIRNSIKNEIVDRIRCTDILLSTGRIKLVKDENESLSDGLCNAVWDEKAITKDVRLDDGTSNIDVLDAFEYSFEPYMRDLLEA